MDDGLKISNDKRHRSSSSLVAGIEGTRSERKLEIRASIPEVDDQFANAEARCEDLQEKIDLVKTLRRKKKLKKRSMTTIAEPAVTVENVPYIKVRAQPKKKVSQQAARLRRLEVPQKAHNPIRGYLDPDLIEQHQMLGRVHGFNQILNPPAQNKTKQSRPHLETVSLPKARRRGRADGDGGCLRLLQNVICDPGISTCSFSRSGCDPSPEAVEATCGQGAQIDVQNLAQEVACGNEDDTYNYLDENIHHRFNGLYAENKERNMGKNNDGRQSKQPPKNRAQPTPWLEDFRDTWGVPPSVSIRHRPKSNRNQENIDENINEKETRPVVELFNKSRVSPEPWQRPPSSSTLGTKNISKTVGSNEELPAQLKGVTPFKTKKPKAARRLKCQSFRYELPTVSSKMKQAGMRCYDGNANTTSIPFIVSKSTAPSHNVGVNLQQVLNGLKIRQPVSGIPLTIAHHMGLRHDPSYGSKSATMQPTLRNSEINVIKLGGRLLRLSSYKHMSYSRLLTLYREGEGIVPRFLRAMSRPHYFYTSEYNLATNNEDFDAATSKGRISSQEAKRGLAAYAHLYREYESAEKSLLQKYDARLARRYERMSRELAAGEEYIRKVVQDYRPGEEVPLRGTASTAEDGYRHSTFKLHEDV